MYTSYRYNEKVVVDEHEIMLTMKTNDTCLKKVLEVVYTNHPSDQPECVSVPIRAGSKAYVDWVKNETANIKPVFNKTSAKPGLAASGTTVGADGFDKATKQYAPLELTPESITSFWFGEEE